MTTSQPMTTTLGKDFSDEKATPRDWTEAVAVLEKAEIYWISTVRPDGRPHVTPLIAVWHDGSLYFATGPQERKAKNLAENPHCIMTTGSNSMSEGFDIVVESRVQRVTDTALLTRLSALYKAKYAWDFAVKEDVFLNEAGGEAYVFEVSPEIAFGFGKGDPYSQTRWRFDGTPQ